MTDHDDIYLQNIPVINSELDYSVTNGIVYVHILNNHFIQRVFRKLRFKVTNKTTIDFDQYASFVFLQIDGKRNIYDIGQIVKAHYGEDAEPLYERLVTFIDYLEDTQRWVLFKNKIK